MTAALVWSENISTGSLRIVVSDWRRFGRHDALTLASRPVVRYRLGRLAEDQHKLVATRTIEEKMETLKQKKRALAESLFDADGAPTLAMTEADLDLLFAPA